MLKAGKQKTLFDLLGFRESSDPYVSDNWTCNNWEGNEFLVHTDLSMKNPIQDCLDWDKPKLVFDTANIIIEYIMTQKYDVGHQMMLMGLLP